MQQRWIWESAVASLAKSLYCRRDRACQSVLETYVRGHHTATAFNSTTLLCAEQKTTGRFGPAADFGSPVTCVTYVTHDYRNERQRQEG
jgi:hypothetical protein